MCVQFRLCSFSVMASVMAAQTAYADLTAADVWADWQSYFANSGYTISGEERSEGSAIVVENMQMVLDQPSQNARLVMNLGTIGFAPAGAGVNVTLQDTWKIGFEASPEGQAKASGTVLVRQEAPTMLVSGAPGDLSYDFRSGRMTVSLDEFSADGESFGPEVFGFRMEMEDIASKTRVLGEGLRTYDQTMTTSRASYDVSFKNPATPDEFSARGSFNNMKFSGDGVLPENLPPDDMKAWLDAGFKMSGAMEFDSASSESKFRSRDGAATTNGSSAQGALGVAFSDKGLLYDVSARDQSVDMVIEQLPLPISFATQNVAFKLAVPVKQSEDPQDFGATLTFAGLTMSDVIWGLFDPAGQLPRDPATLDLDLSGKVKLLVDLLDPTQADVLSQGGTPGELDAVTLNRLVLDMVGARLEGGGAFTFDNTSLTGPGGMPKPTGSVDLKLVGGNGLIDKLVNMGLLPQEQAMGARMVLGLFARPADGPDSLVSKIEINEEGHILANGQRIQ